MFTLSSIRRNISNRFGTNSLPTASMPLITTAELAQNLDKVKILDVSWLKLPVHAHRDPIQEFNDARIPGAQYFDIDTHCDKTSQFPHMLPPVSEFKQTAAAYNLKQDEHIVCYDSLGIFSAPRVWWTMKTFGFKNVSVLDGGLKKWKVDGLPLENSSSSKASTPTPAVAPSVSYDSSLVADYPTIKAAVNRLMKGRIQQEAYTQVIDARSAARFRGEAAEPWPVPSGHMMGAANLPFDEVLNLETGEMLPTERLRSKLVSNGFNPALPAIFTCGSGVSACIPLLAAEVVRQSDRALIEAGKATVTEEGRLIVDGVDVGPSFYFPSLAEQPEMRVFDGAWVEWCTREAAQADQVMNDYLSKNAPSSGPVSISDLEKKGGPVSLMSASGKLQRSIEGVATPPAGGPVKMDVAQRNLGLSLSRSKMGAVGPVRLTDASPNMSASKGGVLFESSDEDTDSEDEREPLALRLSRSKDGAAGSPSRVVRNRRTGEVTKDGQNTISTTDL